ncbi:hypothetical protein [Burkholderia oklahomensis]|uniref:hypothetical protein n=1 Tax=Burkholderia oklahomensis TaxID=342113 RepID=UPI0012F4924C|nr:hypothetical protein [Burkholderia oklahomensis]MBI0363061.1 hypothetical protein [Burkholderia oklahomensis]
MPALIVAGRMRWPAQRDDARMTQHVDRRSASRAKRVRDGRHAPSATLVTRRRFAIAPHRQDACGRPCPWRTRSSRMPLSFYGGE